MAPSLVRWLLEALIGQFVRTALWGGSRPTSGTITFRFAAIQCAISPYYTLGWVQADDFGHYDLSFRNPDVFSPNLEQLARDGIILNRHCTWIN